VRPHYCGTSCGGGLWIFPRNRRSASIVNGIGVSIAGDCRATFRLEKGRVAGVSYIGDGDPLEGENNTCGALMRACLARRG
jgi:hypothetical protein